MALRVLSASMARALIPARYVQPSSGSCTSVRRMRNKPDRDGGIDATPGRRGQRSPFAQGVSAALGNVRRFHLVVGGPRQATVSFTPHTNGHSVCPRRPQHFAPHLRVTRIASNVATKGNALSAIADFARSFRRASVIPLPRRHRFLQTLPCREPCARILPMTDS